MQKSSSDNRKSVTAHRQVQNSTTLNRKYVKRPTRNVGLRVPVKRSPKVTHFADSQVASRSQKEQPLKPVQHHPVQTTANARLKKRAGIVTPTAKTRKPTAKELKDQAIKKALAAAAKPVEPSVQATIASGGEKSPRVHFGVGRIVLALSCAAAAVFAIVYFVNLNMPDISLRVAAVQTGIEASYPSYVPRDFSLSGITSENGTIALNFDDSTTGQSFTLIEESSSWDSNALLNNYVRENYGENYTVVREQGLTIYISDSNATWVNSGMVYKIEAQSDTLSKKQICSIATSL